VTAKGDDLKLLFFIHSVSAGGAERVTVTLANHWASRAAGVTLVTVAGGGNDAYSIDSSVTRVSMRLEGNSGNWLKGMVANVQRVWRLQRTLREYEPDVAISMMPTANSILALSGMLARVPTIGSERIYPPALPLGTVWGVVRRLSYRFLSVVVAQTQEVADWLSVNAPARRIAVIPNPVRFPLDSHEPRVSPDEVLSPEPGRRILLAVGRLEEQKGFDRLLDAFASISERHQEWRLVIIGQGPLAATLAETVAELGIQERVVLPGVVGNLGDWLWAADAYALSSRYEGFPNTLLEALAYGVPSLAVDCETGPREILRHGVDGLLVPQGDPAALEKGLEQLMGDPALRARFAERATEVRDRFAVKRIAQQWETLFEELCPEAR
jgi:glycosyltransferase involved in cell wall biosynthesis